MPLHAANTEEIIFIRQVIAVITFTHAPTHLLTLPDPPLHPLCPPLPYTHCLPTQPTTMLPSTSHPPPIPIQLLVASTLSLTLTSLPTHSTSSHHPLSLSPSTHSTLQLTGNTHMRTPPPQVREAIRQRDGREPPTICKHTIQSSRQTSHRHRYHLHRLTHLLTLSP